MIEHFGLAIGRVWFGRIGYQRFAPHWWKLYLKWFYIEWFQPSTDAEREEWNKK